MSSVTEKAANIFLQARLMAGPTNADFTVTELKFGLLLADDYLQLTLKMLHDVI